MPTVSGPGIDISQKAACCGYAPLVSTLDVP
jgi:hypothetical protein